MTNLEVVQQVIERHREERRWDDAVVAGAVLDALGLDPMADAHAAAEALALVEKARAPVAVVEAPDAPWMADPDAGQMQAANEAAMVAVEEQPVAAEPFQSATHVEPEPVDPGPDPQKVAAEAFAREQAKEGEAHE